MQVCGKRRWFAVRFWWVFTSNYYSFWIMSVKGARDWFYNKVNIYNISELYSENWVR